MLGLHVELVTIKHKCQSRHELRFKPKKVSYGVDENKWKGSGEIQ